MPSERCKHTHTLTGISMHTHTHTHTAGGPFSGLCSQGQAGLIHGAGTADKGGARPLPHLPRRGLGQQPPCNTHMHTHTHLDCVKRCKSSHFVFCQGWFSRCFFSNTSLWIQHLTLSRDPQVYIPHVFIHTYIHSLSIHTHRHSFIYASIHTDIHSFMHPHTQTFIHLCTHTHIHSCTHTYIPAYTHTGAVCWLQPTGQFVYGERGSGAVGV